MSIEARLEHDRVHPATELELLVEAARGDGAVVSFVGIARPRSKAGNLVNDLVLEHHPTLTEKSLKEIAVAAAQRFNVTQLRVVHRCGTIKPGEAIVFAGAASAHRRAAFEAADYLMDRLKTEAVFWKQEIGEGGSVWVEPTDADYADRERWC